MPIISLESVDANFNGHRIVTTTGDTTDNGWLTGNENNPHSVDGWSDDQNCLIIQPELELYRFKYGPGGTMLASRTGQKGGEVTLSLFPTPTESTKFFNNALEEILTKNAVILWEATITDKITGVITRLQRGVMQSGPLGTSYGVGEAMNHQWKFMFERITPDYGSLNNESKNWYTPLNIRQNQS